MKQGHQWGILSYPKYRKLAKVTLHEHNKVEWGLFHWIYTGKLKMSDRFNIKLERSVYSPPHKEEKDAYKGHKSYK